MAERPTRPRVGVLELSTHEDFLADLCTIGAEGAALTVFTTPDIRDRIRESVRSDRPIDWVVPDDEESRSSFLSTVENRCASDLDALWSFPLYGTVFDYLRYARFDPACPFVLAAYDLNGWLGRNPGLTPKVYNYLKYPCKRRLLGRVDAIAVEFEPIREYVGRHVDAGSFHAFTPVLFDGENPTGSTADDRLVVTVPGMVDETRRDYDLLLASLERAVGPDGPHIEVVFLGRPVGDYGRRILRRATALEARGATITTFDGWIPTETFAAELARSDLLASPLRRTRRIDGFVETYGRSKGSGAISDAIRHATPLALPAWYQVPERVAPGIVTFDGPADLGELLVELAADGTARERLRDGAHEMASRYTLAAQDERFRAVLDAAMGR